MLLYASFQAIAVGAYVAVADVLETREDALKAAWAGFVINGVLLTLASLTVFSLLSGYFGNSSSYNFCG